MNFIKIKSRYKEKLPLKKNLLSFFIINHFKI